MMSLPPQRDLFQALTRVVHWLGLASLVALFIAFLAWMFLGHSSSYGNWEAPDWIGILAKYSAYALAVSVIYAIVVNPFTTMYYIVKAKPGDGWTFWRLTKGALIAADPGMYWLSDRDGLVALRPTMDLFNNITVGGRWIHNFSYSIVFKGQKVTREAAVAFYNWWQALPAHRRDVDGMHEYLAKAERADDLPFTVAVHRGTAPALAT